jgi:hypothetical protein
VSRAEVIHRAREEDVMIGYAPPKRDGKSHEIEVTVTRSGLKTAPVTRPRRRKVSAWNGPERILNGSFRRDSQVIGYRSIVQPGGVM